VKQPTLKTLSDFLKAKDENLKFTNKNSQQSAYLKVSGLRLKWHSRKQTWCGGYTTLFWSKIAKRVKYICPASSYVTSGPEMRINL